MKFLFGLILAGSALVTSLEGVDFSLAPNRASADTNSSSSLLFGDKVVARGKGFEITQSQLEEAFTGIRVAAAAQGQSIPESRRAETETEALERLINVQVLLQQATDEDRMAAKEKSAKAMVELKRRQPNEDAFRRQLLVIGLTEEKFRTRLYEESLFKEIIDRKLRSAITISDEQARKFYDANPARFDQPERVRLAQIVILCQNPETRLDLPENETKAKRQLADKLWQRILNGEDFAKLAKEYSDDYTSRDSGGELPPMTSTNMTPELAKAAFVLTNNQVSEVIASPVGYHILKLKEKIPAKKAAFADVEADIKNYLAYQETQKRLPDYLRKLRETAGVEVLPRDKN
jgi:peptidyl-prolyl cis-trans isomerase C